MKYLIASLRGPDFEIEGDSPEDAWNNLCEREKENGTIWRTGDIHRNQYAVKMQGFTHFKNMNAAYKEVSNA